MRLLAFAIVLALVLPAAVSAETVVVQMATDPDQGFQPRFLPSDVTIRVGDTIRWINMDDTSLEHVTCSGTGSADPFAGDEWLSPSLRFGEWYEHTFDTVGAYEYYSVPHEFTGMFGVVNVISSTGNPEVVSSTWSRIKNDWKELLPRE